MQKDRRVLTYTNKEMDIRKVTVRSMIREVKKPSKAIVWWHLEITMS